MPRLNETLLIQAFADYISAIERVHCLEIECQPSLEEINEMREQYERVRFINDINKYHQHTHMDFVPMFSNIQGNC